ncbi:MAG: tRNA pseudouridine(38-40) synthase TruA [Propionibacteriaceae bacterium]|jgi:tRNA pseudouridine38-40 synthase|nr:tRNA pseudouridine(38-40) synthase TruA [Propionibacteriaceae bacterium]
MTTDPEPTNPMTTDPEPTGQGRPGDDSSARPTGAVSEPTAPPGGVPPASAAASPGQTLPDPDWGPPPGRRRLRLDLAYDGTDFAGWAKQPGLRTVEGELETRLTRLLRLAEPVALTVAGRTDAGVHARGQVCHVDLPETVVSSRGQTWDSAEALRRWLPRGLPDDIALRDVTVAPPGFDARFAARWRRYVYRLADQPLARDPLERRYVAPTPALDVAAMAQAAVVLVGLHDFTALCRARPGASAVRRLLLVEPRRVGPGRVDVTVAADAFCHSMVRSLVGALCAVGQGRRDAAWLAGLLDRRQRAGEVTVMPALGLTLEEVRYPAAADLARRQAEARQVRRPPV